jgi:hypothetical protein
MTTAETSRSTASGGRKSTGRLVIIIVLAMVGFALLWLLLRGIQPERIEDINAEYGRRQGIESADSVNGTNVLAEMFEKRGQKVITWRKLSPKLNKVDTIVWFPDDMEPPTEEQREWLEKWLADSYNRTLIYVGRDYDAEIAYWERVLPNAPAEERSKIKSRLDLAKERHKELRESMPTDDDADWFVVRSVAAKRSAGRLEGPWVHESGIDAGKTWIEVHGYLDEPNRRYYETDVLLESGRVPLVFRIEDPSYEWGNGKIVVVANGSFLLNLPLVNHEHRKLASLLVDECEFGDTVAFVESGANSSLKIRDSDFQSQNQAWYSMLTVWPLNAVILHIAAAGIVFCFAMFPIFGRPHTTDSNDASDFGKHIDALGRLLAKTQDSEYAVARLAYYEGKVKRDSGASHGE